VTSEVTACIYRFLFGLLFYPEDGCSPKRRALSELHSVTAQKTALISLHHENLKPNAIKHLVMHDELILSITFLII
jgi:hypothetical protein